MIVRRNAADTETTFDAIENGGVELTMMAIAKLKQQMVAEKFVVILRLLKIFK